MFGLTQGNAEISWRHDLTFCTSVMDDCLQRSNVRRSVFDTVLYLKSYRRRGVQEGCARGVCKGVCKGCARAPVGHLSDENKALGPRNPFMRVPMSGFDKNMCKKYKKEKSKIPKGGV